MSAVVTHHAVPTIPDHDEVRVGYVMHRIHRSLTVVLIVGDSVVFTAMFRCLEDDMLSLAFDALVDWPSCAPDRLRTSVLWTLARMRGRLYAARRLAEKLDALVPDYCKAVGL